MYKGRNIYLLAEGLQQCWHFSHMKSNFLLQVCKPLFFSILELNNRFCFSISLLGGEDFDQKIMDYFIKMYKKKKGKDIRKDNRAVQKLRREVEKAKRGLSTQHQARIEIESFFDGEDFSETLTRARFENENMVGIFV